MAFELDGKPYLSLDFKPKDETRPPPRGPRKRDTDDEIPF